MMIQYTIIATILAACILYAAFRIYKSLQQANKCKLPVQRLRFLRTVQEEGKAGQYKQEVGFYR